MKRLFAFVALAVLVLATGTASGAYYDGQNDGSSWENAYVIESSADLVLMRDRVNAGTEPYGKYYKLSADINLASIAGWNHIGTNNGFRGHFDGQNHTITLSADKGSLFDAIITEEDTIAVRNLNIIGSAIGSYGIGSSAIATEFNSGIIENCNFMGSISTTERPTTFLANIYEASPSGGIVKNMYGGTISNCTVSADISSTSSDAGGIVGRMSGGVIENCTVNDGTTITASGYVGGIAGNASGDVTFSGNTWPAGYPQAGNSSSDILAKIATTLGATPVRVPVSAFTSATPVTSSDTASDRQYAASHDMFIAVAISPMASLADGAYYNPVTFSTLPSGRTLATSADFSFYPDGLGANMTSAYVAVFNASGDEVTEPSSVLGKEGYIAFIIENGSIRGTSSDNSLNRPTLTLPLASAGNNNTDNGNATTVVDSVLYALKDRGYVDINNQLTNLAFVSGSIPTLTLASDGTYTATVSLKFDVSSWNFAVADNGSVTKQFSSSQFSSSSIGNGSLTPTSSNTARISLDPSEISIGSHAVTLTVTPTGATHTASVSLGNVIGISNAQYYSRGNDGSSWENAYILESSADLILMRDRVNDGSDGNGKYYKLSADIDLTTVTHWFYIGGSNEFTGHFDGQGHTITLSSTTPLFCDISSDEDTIAVRNLNITGNVTDTQIACPLAINLHSGIVENCSFRGTLKSTNSVASGLVYWVQGGTIRNCTVSADILSSEWSGGIVASFNKGTIENCTIESGTRITALSRDAGGIVGWFSEGTVKNCTVEAGTVITAPNQAGGIAGHTYARSGVTINNCTVEEGTVITGSIAGGIIGYASNGITLSGNTWPSSYSQTGTSSGGNAAPSPTPDSNDNQPPTTPQITWNGHRYQAYNENLTWEEAKSRCESLGGHLATITSSLEQEQAENLLRQSTTSQRGYWLGASADISGFWKWTTGEEFERQYMNFPGGQQESSGNYLYMYWTPNSAEGTITASAATNQGEWDCAGNASYGFICEWDNEPSTVQEAPTDSDFQRWQQDPDSWKSSPESTTPSGANPSPIDTSHLASNPPNIETPEIPVSYDARKEGRLTPVRHQGIYDTCWAFAALGAMEADYMTHNMTALGTSPDLSELHLAWFAYEDPSSDHYGKNYEDSALMAGGTTEIATSYLTKATISPVNENDMPYTVVGNSEEQASSNIATFLNGRKAENFSKARITLAATEIEDRIPKNDPDTVKRIKERIMRHGAVYFRYLNNDSGYNDDKTAFYSVSEGYSHAALLVGWDDNYPAENFRDNPGSNGAWLVRTSRWNNKQTKELVKTGDDEYGCFWMSYAQAATDSGMTALQAFSVSEDLKDLQHNGGTTHTKDITPAWSARIFQAGRNERLVRIGFDTTDNNASYQIFVNKFTGTPTDPGRAENSVLSGDIPNAGYHTLNLPAPVDLYEGNYYAVIVKMLMSPSSSYRYPTAVGASMDKYAQIEVNEAESFFAEGNEVPSVWQDGINVEGGPYKACIMTFTEARTTFDTAPSIMTSSLPDATVGQHYSFLLSSSGTQAIEWRSGNIPEDFTLSRTGTLTGQPQEAGQYDINLTAVNDVGYVEKVLSLTVNAAGNTNDSETNDSETNDTNTDNTNQEQEKTPDDDNTQNDTQQEDETPSPIKASGGGCDSGIQIAGLAVIFILAGVKRWRRK